jgi:hypothetical protein
MAVELVITSVRKGLDGGSGYQPVLRTKGLKPAIAERLQLRSGYPHPYSHGDRRNPVVYVHRIERVGGETLHVLARICDAGSDHTGRSNFLAHLVAINDGEARRKGSGPADVIRRLAFKASWDEPPREEDSPAVIASDRGPGPCLAWEAAGLDPGLAGDLAEAAASGRDVRLIVRQSDDVLALFADALALVPPAKRWQVTFTTCEIEPFDAVWRAVREDLPQARALRAAAGVIDLTRSDSRGSDGAFAKFARGAASQLPWAAASRPADAAHSGEALSSRPESPRSGNAPVTAGAARVPASSGAADAIPSEVASRIGPPAMRRGKRNYLDQIPVADRTPGPWDEEDRVESSSIRSLLPLLAIGLVGVLLVGVLWFLNTDDGKQMLAQLTRNDAPQQAAQEEITEESSSRDDFRELRKKGVKLPKEDITRQQKEQEARDQAAAQKLKEEEDREARRKKQEAADAEQESRLQTTLADQRKAEAFAALQQLPEAVATDLPLPNGPSGQFDKAIDLGVFNPADLIDLSFALAVPNETIDGAPFKPTIVPPTDANPMEWKIQFTRANDSKPVDLATLVAEKGRLSIRASHKNIVKNPAFYYLRRSVLLVRARDPSKPDEPSGLQGKIQLVRPVMAGALTEVPMLPPDEKGSTTHKGTLPFPPAIVPQRGQDRAPALPSQGLTINYELRFDYERNGTENVTTYTRGLDSPPFQPLLNCPAHANIPPDPPTVVGVKIRISVEDGVMHVTPETEGPGKHFFNLDELAPIVRKSDEEYEKWKKAEITKLQRRVTSMSRYPTENGFPAFVEDYGTDFARFLDEKDPETAGKKWMQEIKNINDDFSEHNKAARTAGGGFSQSNPQLKLNEKALLDRWQKVVAEALGDWLKDYVRRMEAEGKRLRSYFAPLKGSVKVAIQGISCVVHDGDDKTYTVKLVVPTKSTATTKSQQATPIPKSSTDIEAPKGDGNSD